MTNENQSPLVATRGLRVRFSCAHLYHQTSWDSAKNQAVFGKCFSEHGHGHDYELWIETTELDSFAKLKTAAANLREQLDHQHLNFAIPEFSTQVPTTENLVLYCSNFLKTQMGEPNLQLELTLFECPWLGAQTTEGVS
ncbi:MAG: 6-carboxytetrahydropterin synthase [Bdellovibrio sp.]